MPISVEWFDDEQTIALYRIEDYWTIENLVEQLKKHYNLGDRQPIYYIVDMSDVNMMPSGILSRRNEYMQFMQLDNGMTVIVQAPRLIVMLTKSLIQLGIKMHKMEFADSISEAAKAIEAHKQICVEEMS